MTLDKQKLAKVLARLASDHGGERASAALQATRMLSAAEMSWNDILGLKEPPRPRSPRPWDTGEKLKERPADWLAIVGWLCGQPDRLSGAEYAWVRNCARYRGTPKSGTYEYFKRLYERLKAT